MVGSVGHKATSLYELAVAIDSGQTQSGGNRGDLAALTQGEGVLENHNAAGSSDLAGLKLRHDLPGGARLEGPDLDLCESTDIGLLRVRANLIVSLATCGIGNNASVRSSAAKVGLILSRAPILRWLRRRYAIVTGATRPYPLCEGSLRCRPKNFAIEF